MPLKTLKSSPKSEMDDEINEKDLEDIDENDLLDELNALALGNDEQSDDLILKQLEDECDSNITSDTIPNDFCDVAILSDPMSDKLLAPSDSDPITVPSQKTIPSNLMTDKLLVLSQRQQEYTAFALHLKNTGNAPSAREMLSIAKKIQIALENQNHAFIIPPPPSSLKIKQNSAVITSIPNRVVNPVESKQISSPKLIQSVPVTEDAWQFLQTNLESQIKLCTKIASSHLQNNRKDEAVKFHIQKKLCVAWLDSIKALQKTPNSICPQFHFSTINYEIQDIQDDVPTDQIEVSISKVWDLDVSKAGGCDGDLHAVIVFGFPNDDKPSRFQSPILKYDANVGILLMI